MEAPPEERLERGEILTFAPCPFPLPAGDDLAFLMQQRLSGTAAKNITYNPAGGAVAGFLYQSAGQAERLRALLRDFSDRAAAWLGGELPGYAAAWARDRASFRPEEEAIRKLRLTARNDLLHIDAFPSRPTRGHRILRLFVNINPTDDRVWVTADTFAQVLERYGTRLDLQAAAAESWADRISEGLLSLFRPSVQERTAYDRFMLRLHHFLKTNDEFQDRAGKRFWHFKPGTAWVVFTDALTHAELRGQYALEHSFFVAPHTLRHPAESPPALLERACGTPVLPRAA